MVEDDHGEGGAVQDSSQAPGCMLDSLVMVPGLETGDQGLTTAAGPQPGSSPDSIPNTSSHHGNVMAHILIKKNISETKQSSSSLSRYQNCFILD